MIRTVFTAAAAFAACTMAPAALAQTATSMPDQLPRQFSITGLTAGIGDGSAPVENVTVVIDGGIVAIGAAVQPDAAYPVYDGSGLWITPGLFASVTDLGLYDVGSVSESNDKGANRSRFNAALDVGPAINPASESLAVSLAAGITRATITPNHGGSIFAGQGALIHTWPGGQPFYRDRKFQLVELGEGGARMAGGSRTAAHVELRNALAEAQNYADGRWAGEDSLLTRADAEALVPVLKGEQALYVEVERASDITEVLQLKRQYGAIDMVLVGVSEGWLVADAIASAGVPVIADPLDDLPSSFEQLAATQSNVGRMVDAGVTVALGRLAGTTDGHPRSLAQFAGNLVALQSVPGATGLSWGEALAAITSVPAKLAGMENRYGTLQAGTVDFVLWSGDPLEVRTVPVKVVADAQDRPLTNRQTELAKRYRDLDESDLPKAYDW